MVASGRNGTIYVGVTGRLLARAAEHRAGQGGGFAARAGCKWLVWYEVHETMERAILREKQIKAGSRVAKLRLIEGMNPEWRDLFGDIV
jgi:putative endonuclease